MDYSRKFVGAFVCLIVFAAWGADQKATGAHMMASPNDLKWTDGPLNMPAGQKMAVLYGDPSKEGMFIIRAKMPANYKIPAHSHLTDETVTVIRGTVMMGMGDKLDSKHAMTLPAGGFAMMPAHANHYFMAKTDAVVQVSGMGPLSIIYVNPDDDPSAKATQIAK